jgi:hypothetical protein
VTQKLPYEDTKVSKHAAVYITQTDCCDIYCNGINCAFVGYNKKHSNVLRCNYSMINSLKMASTDAETRQCEN